MVAVARKKEPLADGFSAYLKSISDYKPISADEERDIACLYRQTGDPALAQKLILSNVRFVIKVALEYRWFGCDLNELVQEGNLGLAEAVQRFDPSRGTRLVTYASWWIRDRIRQRIARSRSVSAKGTTRAERSLRSGDDGRVRPLADLPLDAVNPVDLSTDESPDRFLIEHEESNRLWRLLREGLQGMDERERRIVNQRFLQEDPVSLAVLGSQLGVSRERVRQLAERARKKLKARLTLGGFAVG